MKYTLILYYNSMFHVGVTKTVSNFIKTYRDRNKDFQIILYIEGDFRRKIRNLGLKNFLRCYEGISSSQTAILQFQHNRSSETV